MADFDPIPLYDGEITESRIVTNRPDGPERAPLRGGRGFSRRGCERTSVCFSPEHLDGRNEHVECPVIDLCESGMALEFDRPLKVGVHGLVRYATISRQPVCVGCRVQRCILQADGSYVVGLKFDRLLRFDERKPAVIRPGREVAPGIRPRKLDDAGSEDRKSEVGSQK